jgi:hypothetical protein
MDIQQKIITGNIL